MRAYFFGNMYLSSIQQGIQAKHAGDEMVIRYLTAPVLGQEGVELSWEPSKQACILGEWLHCHKTVVLLNAGYSSTIRDIQAFMMDNDNHYPWAVFHEGKDALDGALTCLGIVLPPKIYEASRLVRTIRAGFDNIRIPRQMIWEDGELIIHKENEYGIEVETDTVWTYNRWEAKLIDELNKYGLAK